MPRTITVRAGDTLLSIAAREGRDDPSLIWDDEANRDLRGRRPDPNQLVPGDQVVVPDAAPRWEVVALDRRHVFRLTQALAVLTLRVEDPLGALANARWRLLVDGEPDLTGTTDGAGTVVCFVKATVTRARLRVEPFVDRWVTFDLDVGHLQPASTMPGLQARLINLGYPCPASGEADRATQQALRLFQGRFLPQHQVTGQADDPTLARLEALTFPA